MRGIYHGSKKEALDIGVLPRPLLDSSNCLRTSSHDKQGLGTQLKFIYCSSDLSPSAPVFVKFHLPFQIVFLPCFLLIWKADVEGRLGHML